MRQALELPKRQLKMSAGAGEEEGTEPLRRGRRGMKVAGEAMGVGAVGRGACPE